MAAAPFWNIHTHRWPAESPYALVNVSAEASPEVVSEVSAEFSAEASAEFSAECFAEPSAESPYFSVGIHPWQADRPLAEERRRVEAWLKHPRCIALGESGLDKVCGVDEALQREAFRWMAELACRTERPLLIHCVKASNEVMALHRQLCPRVPWVVHGFRGKRALAEQWLAEGFYLSFGFRFQEEALRSVPSERLLLESDEERLPIASLYERVAQLRETGVEQLAAEVTSNVNRLFFRL
jgi:TatD DNase family protein